MGSSRRCRPATSRQASPSSMRSRTAAATHAHCSIRSSMSSAPDSSTRRPPIPPRSSRWPAASWRSIRTGPASAGFDCSSSWRCSPVQAARRLRPKPRCPRRRRRLARCPPRRTGREADRQRSRPRSRPTRSPRSSRSTPSRRDRRWPPARLLRNPRSPRDLRNPRLRASSPRRSVPRSPCRSASATTSTASSLTGRSSSGLPGRRRARS